MIPAPPLAFVEAERDLHAEDWKRWARERRLSLPDYLRQLDSHAKLLASRSRVWVRIGTPALLRIAAGEPYRTTYDRTVPRLFGDGNRKRLEESLGVPRNAPPTARPMYGYLCEDGAGLIGASGHEVLSVYGDVAIRLRPDVHSVTAITFYPVQAAGQVASPLQVPSHLSFPAMMPNDPLTILSTDQVLPYCEAYIFTRVNWRSVDLVVFPPRVEPGRWLRARMAGFGIGWKPVQGTTHTDRALIEQGIAQGHP